MTKNVGVLGSGNVGQTLAKALSELDYDVTIGSRSGKEIDGWSGKVATFDKAASKGELIILAVKGSAAEEVVESVKEQLAGKTVIDTTNPISEQPPIDGVLNFFTKLDDSLMERLQKAAPDAHFVKAFNSIGSAYINKPSFKEGRPTMFICGGDQAAKREVGEIIEQLGWEVADMGATRAARAIEPLCMLWCIPGLLRNEWAHAFKLLNQ